MLDVLKSLLPSPKEFLSLRMPRPFQEAAALSFFVFLLVLLCGLAYFFFAVDPMPSPVRAELIEPGRQLWTYLRCGANGLLWEPGSGVSLRDFIGLFIVVAIWYILMCVSGFLTKMIHVVERLPRGDLDATKLEIDESELARLLGKWEAFKEKEEFGRALKEYRFAIFIVRVVLVVVRTILLAGILFLSCVIFFNNIREGAVFPPLGPFHPILEVALRPQQPDRSATWFGAWLCLICAWISFRHSGAGFPWRAILLAVALVNIMLFSGEAGSLYGRGTIRLQKIQIFGDRFTSSDIVPIDSDVLLLSRHKEDLTLYSCKQDRLVKLHLAQGDIVALGDWVPLSHLCQSTR